MPEPERRRWTIEFYYDHRGCAPVQEFIRGLPERVQGRILAVIDKLELFGPYLRMPDARHIRGKLWELRAGRGRVFYFAHVGGVFVLLHGYVKKTRKAPEKEIKRAERNLLDYMEHR